MPNRRLFTNEIAAQIRSTQTALMATSKGGNGTLPTLNTVQQGKLATMRSPDFTKFLDAVLVVPMVAKSTLGPQIQGSATIYHYRWYYIRRCGSDENISQTTIHNTELLLEAMMNIPNMEDLQVPGQPGLRILRFWPESIDYEPEEDRMFEARLDLQVDMACADLVVETKAARY